MAITATLEEYLRVAYYLKNKKSRARVTDMAKMMDISKSSVNNALKTLTNLGYIEYENYGEIIFTEEGVRIAKESTKKYEVLRDFLIVVLGVRELVAEEEARKMKSYVSDNTIMKFDRYLRTIKKIDKLSYECREEMENERYEDCIRIAAQNILDKRKKKK